MIEWPAEAHLTSDAKAALQRFKKTAAAAELEEDPRTWRFLSWARSTEPPVRMRLRSEDQGEVTFTLESSGTWTMARREASANA